IRRNSDLRRLLVSTGNRSIIVVEDIDCSLDFNKRKALPVKAATPSSGAPTPVDSQLTLSGMLNFIDGLWSSCGNERIIVFTTNNIDKLDPALLRPGRMDVHIHMSYCTPSGFKLLAYNYLKVSHHGVFKEIEKLLETTNVTPAEVAETLMRDEDPDVSLEELLGIIQNRHLETAKTSSEVCLS
ncbi:Aaa-atpase, partial [Thalictrum thalictroides]